MNPSIFERFVDKVGNDFDVEDPNTVEVLQFLKSYANDQHDALSTILVKYYHNKKDLVNTKKELRELTISNNLLKRMLKNMQDEYKELEEISDFNYESNQAIRQLHHETLRDFKISSACHSKQITALKADYASDLYHLHSEIAQLRESLHEFAEDNINMEEHILEMKSFQLILQDDIDHYHLENKRLEQLIENSDVSSEASRQVIIGLSKTLRDHAATIERLEKDNHEMFTQLRKSRISHVLLEKRYTSQMMDMVPKEWITYEYKRHNDDVAELEAVLVNLRSENGLLKNNLTTHQNQCRYLNNELIKANQKVKEVGQSKDYIFRINRLTEDLKEVNDQNYALKQELEETKATIKAMEDDFAHAEKEDMKALKNLREKLNATLDEKSSLEERIETLERNIESYEDGMAELFTELSRYEGY